ncbi:MAG: DPP IV N-terminal domain-containing protein [Paludibacteraceae bacterium]|nr:DPP IV N-terminal domain-containing protein [Paludibacteraceae bacterium]
MMHLLQGGYDAKVLTDHQMDSILNADSDDRYKLECENKQQLFRHSFLADYYLVDKQKNTRIHLGDGLIRDPKISDNGKYVVYAKPDNNLYIYKVDFQTEVAITKDTTAHILNGVADWLYEEEFGITSIVSISPDSKLVAFVRFNEADVPSFEWQTYLEGNYPKSHFLKYPKAGETNPKISVCVYDIHYKSIRTMQLPDMQNSYVPRLCWSVMPAGKADAVPDLMVLQLNRDQNLMQVHKVNAKSTVSHPFYREESKKHYVNFEYFDDWQWLSDGRVIVISEKGGYAQAYLYSPQGIEQRLLTPEKRDIMRVYGWDEMLQTLYFQAAPTPTTRHAYAYSLRKNYTTQLTKGEGVHALTFSKDMTRYIDCYQSNTIPNRYTLYAKGSSRLLLSNDSVASAWKASGLQNKEFFTIRTERGDVLNAWKVLPVGFDQTKKYPVVMMQYSGPSSQRVTDSWRKRFAHYLSAQGYLVVCADGRGTHARGREWRNATYMQLGTNEAEDQISVAKYLRTLPYVDAERIALCGWSYGGYQTIMSMSMQPTEDGKPLWKCGMAIAPVTSWRLYDAAYTERYMRRPQVNEYGYDQTDAMKLADKLQGKLLLVHGLADDNVHAQQSWLYVDALVKAGKQFEMQFYPDDNHFLRNGSNYEHLHNRLLLFLQNNL